ncbi:MAG: hypothetical protein C4289_13215 [Chloroflexota bacterium]
MLLRPVVIGLTLLSALGTLLPVAPARAEQAPAAQSAPLAGAALPRYFPETGYRIGLDQFFRIYTEPVEAVGSF